jgi:integrase
MARLTVDGRTYKRSGPTKPKAKAQLDKMRRQVSDGLPVGDDTRLGAWLDWYSEVVVAKLDVNTQDNYAWAFAKLDPLAAQRLRSLDVAHVERILRNLQRAGLGENSLTRVKTCLGAALHEAERRNLVSRNVARLAHVPAGAAPSKDRRSLTARQAAAFLTAARAQGYEALVLTALTLGLRPGEVLGLQWSAVDLEEGTVEVVRSLKRRTKAPPVLGRTKVQSDRTVRLPERLCAVLSEHRTEQKRVRMAAPVWEDHDLVFCTAMGTPIDHSNLRRTIDSVSNAAKLGHWTPNELRHSAGSLLIAEGVAIPDVSDILGNTPRVLMQTYRHKVKPVIDVTAAQTRMLNG